MSHTRQQIRDAAVTLLTGLTTTGSKVYASRIYPMQDANLPGLCVYTSSEEIDEELGKVEHIQYRNLTLTVEGYGKLTSGLDDQLDTIASEVETALLADQFFSGLLQGLDLVSIETEITEEAEQPIGVVRLTFNAHYLTTEGTPGTAL